MKPRIVKLYSENNDYQHIEVLKRNRVKRNKYKEFFIEGVKSINRAIENNWKILSLVYSTERPLSNWAQNIIENSQAETHFDIPARLMDKLSDKEDTSELLAVASMPENDINRIKLKDNMLVLVFDRPSNYGNLGTIIRSCDSFNVDGLIITGHGVDLYDPQTIRSSMGSFFKIPCIKLDSHNEILKWYKSILETIPDLQLVGTSAKASFDVIDCDLTKPTILVIGNETDGMSKGYKEICNPLIKISIYGSATSLNVACAASIFLYEIDRQRRIK